MSEQILGVDINQQDDLSQFNLGQKYVNPSTGNTYRYVRAAAAKTIGLIYSFDETYTVAASALVKTDISANAGISHQTTTAADTANGYTYKHFWIQTAGNFGRIEAAAASADNAQCYSTSTAGKVDDGDDSGKTIKGMIFTAAAGSATNTTGYSGQELYHSVA